MPGPVNDKVRQELRRLGTRRRRMERDEAKLARDTRKVLNQAKGRMSVSEAAKLAGVSRSTAYDVYLR